MTCSNKSFKSFLIFSFLGQFKPYRFQNKSIGFLNFVQLQFVLRRFEVLRQFLCIMQYRASLAATDELGAAKNLQAQYIAKELNIPYAQVKLYNSSDKDTVAGNSAGMDPKDKNDHNVFLNKAENSNNQSDSYILNHEISHEKDKADGIIRGEDFANLMGAKGDDALAKELSYAGLGAEANTTDDWREFNFDNTLLNTNTKLAESYGYDEVDQSDINIILQRTDENNERTLGEVTISNTANSKIANFYTLERPDRNNQNNVSRVNADMYKAELVKSSSYPFRVLRLEDKHGRTDVLEHNGNYVSDSEGCILLGKEQYKNSVGFSLNAIKERNKYIDDIKEIDKKNGEPTNIYYYIKDINYVKK